MPPTVAHGFTDVASGAWFTDGLSWAAEHGVVRGFADGTFRPAEPVNRGQLAAYLQGIASTPTGWTPGATPPGPVLF